MIALPTTIGDLDLLIKDQVQEDLHLDYKASPALDKSKKDEIAKDVSAFANSDGGILIYGIVEKNNLPTRKDDGAKHSTYSREWLEQIISSKITPRLDGVVISPIQFSPDRSYYAVQIPKSFRGPHQAPDKKYYKRFNFINWPMEDYEITDVRNRRQVVPRIVGVDITIRQKSWVYLNIENVGEQTAEDVRFDVSPELESWIDQRDLKLFKNGIKYFPPSRLYSFNYGFINALVHEGSKQPSEFQIGVSYFNPSIGERISDTFRFDLMDYWGSSVHESEINDHAKEMKEAIKKLTDEVAKVNYQLSRVTPLAGPTGLDLSITSLRNFRRLLSIGTESFKINPAYQSYQVFVEVLGIDFHMACRLEDFFRRGNYVQGLEDLEGMTPDLLKKLEDSFELSDESPDT